MNKNGKKALVIILLIILIGIVIWFVYKKVTSNNTNLVPTNETLSQDSIIGNDILQNAVDEANEIEENTVTNDITNEVSDGKVEEEEKEPEEEKEGSSSNNSSGSEVVSGTETSREERAIELTKEYYADEYGSTDGIYFRCDSVNSDGRYRVIASANAATVGFFYVDINNGKVEEK